MRRSLYLSVATFIWAIGAIVLGGLVTATDAASQCTGWPLCNGQLSPSSDLLGTLTFGHRFGGFGLLLLTAGLVGVTLVRLRRDEWLGRLALTAFTLVLLQSVVGGFSVIRGLPGSAVSIHLLLAFGVAGVAAVAIISVRQRLAGATRIAGLPVELAGMAKAVVLLTPLVLTLASFFEISGVPAIGSPAGAAGWIYVLGGVTTLIALILLRESLILETSTETPRLTIAISSAAIALSFLLAAGLPAVGAPQAFAVIPLGLAAAGWAGLLALVAGHWLSTGASIPALPDRAHLKTLIRDFLRVTKPGIMLLLLITTLGAMLIAARGWPSLQTILLTLLGGALASGGASALNCYYDRDIDVVMARTRKRPIPTGGLTPDQVRVWGLILSVMSVIVLAAFVNPLAALMALAGNVFYVLIYTRKLKRSTPQNIVIGGAAGSFPPLVGWAAVTGSLSLGAFLIAAIVFYWTPPHFWSLALLKKNDYKRAGIPMLPVTHGEHETRRRIVLYSFLLLGVTLLMVPAGVVGVIYGVTALLLGTRFVIMAIQMFREDTSRLAWPLFKYSNYYLAALLAAMAVDHFIRL